MFLIAHRGNTHGIDRHRENSPKYIQEALDQGYHVEIDVRYINNKWFLGHDEPQYEIQFNYLKNDKFWCHAKNLEALDIMLKTPDIHCFWHQTDDYTITSNNIIWAFPGKKITENSIAVLPETYYKTLPKCLGVCSDLVYLYKNL